MALGDTYRIVVFTGTAAETVSISASAGGREVAVADDKKVPYLEFEESSKAGTIFRRLVVAREHLVSYMFVAGSEVKREAKPKPTKARTTPERRSTMDAYGFTAIGGTAGNKPPPPPPPDKG